MTGPRTLVARVAGLRLRGEKAYVAAPENAHRLHLRAVARVLLALAALMVFTLDIEGWWRIPAGVVVGWLSSTGALEPLMRASAYRFGWLDGRRTMMLAFAEATRRGMELREWALAEYARDLPVLGMAVKGKR